MEEVWKLVEPDDSRSYEVSNLGRVRVALKNPRGVGRFHAGHVMKPNIQNAGYHVVWLRRGGKSCIRLVHRLVAAAFCQPKGCEVNHIDGNKLNNRADNLEWVSRQYNVDHSIENNLREPKLSQEDRDRIRRLYTETSMTQRQIGNLYGVSDVLISHVLTGKCYSRDGHITKPSNRRKAKRQSKIQPL